LDKNNSPVQLINQLRGFFYINPLLKNSIIHGSVYNQRNIFIKSFVFNYKDIVLSSPITITISIITLTILLFIFINKEWLSMGAILAQIFLNFN
jgi:NADH-ubiquinone oxidoreductase chain 2